MTRTEQGGAREWAWELLTGLLLAGVILCAGTLLAGLLRQYGGEQMAEQAILQTELRVEETEHIARGRLFDLFKEYTLAFADAAIQFDTVPKFDTRTVYSFAAALSEDVEITGMAFLGHDIRADGLAADTGAAETFLARLRADSRFDSVRTGALVQTASNAWHFSVTCTPRMEEGQLAPLSMAPE